jgi:hypothetical protein
VKHSTEERDEALLSVSSLLSFMVKYLSSSKQSACSSFGIVSIDASLGQPSSQYDHETLPDAPARTRVVQSMSMRAEKAGGIEGT